MDDSEEIELDETGLPVDVNLLDKSAAIVYDALVAFARDRGCTCRFRLFLAQPFPEYCGMKLEHEMTCMGNLRQAGIEGRN